MLKGIDIGKRIERALKDADKTKSALAEHCGVTPQAVTGWVKKGRVSKGRLSKIASFTGKSLDFFLNDIAIPLTRLVVSAEDEGDVRQFLAADIVWRKLWLQVVKNSDTRLARVIELYELADEEGREMVLNGARGSFILRGLDEPGSEQKARRPHRKRS